MTLTEESSLVSFLSSCSTVSLGEFLLAKQNRVANLEKQLREILGQAISNAAFVELARILRSQGQGKLPLEPHMEATLADFRPKPNRNGDDPLRPTLHSIDAERRVLGAIIMDNKTIEIVMAKIQKEDFFHIPHRTIFRCMVEMSAKKEPIDLVLLVDRLEKERTIEDVGGIGYISALIDGVPRISNIDFYADVVAEKAGRRKAISALRSIQLDYETSTADLAQVDARAETTLAKLFSEFKQGTKNCNGKIGNDLIPFLQMDFPQPEHLIEGLIPKNGTVMIVAMPHRMKSFFTTALALAATKPGTIFGKLEVPKAVRTMLVQVEDSPGEVQKRLRGFLETSQFANVDPTNLRIVNRAEFTAFNVEWAESFARQAVEWKADLIIFDVLRRLFVNHGDLNSAQDTSIFLEIIDKIRSVTGAAIVLVHHENRKEAELMWASAGSYTLPSWANVVIQFKKKTEEKHITRVEIEVDNKLANSPEPMRMVLDFTSPNPIMLESLEEGSSLSEALDGLGSQWTVRDLMECMQITHTSARRRLKKWIEVGSVEKIFGAKPGRGGGLARYQETVRIP